MSGETEREIFRAFTLAQDRYGYFLMAAAGAAIAFAVARTDSAAWTSTMWLWLSAVVCWGASFYSGLKYVRWIGAGLRTNLGLLKVQDGSDALVGTHPMNIAVATEVIREASDKGSRWMSGWATAQLTFLAAGAVAYIVWHVWEMVGRST